MTAFTTSFTKVLRDSALVFRRSAREGRRQLALAYVAPTLLSLAIVLIFQTVYGRIADVPGFPTDTFIDWVAPGAILLSVFLGAGFTASGLVRDATSGYLDRLRLLPVHPAALLLGRVGFDAARALPPAVAVLAVALAFGIPNQGGALGLAGPVLLAVALAIGWNGIFYVVALRTLSPAALQGMQVLFMPVIMFSTFWVPPAFMPGWYAEIATHNPLSPLIDAGRSILAGRPDGGDLAAGLGALALLSIITYAVASRRLHGLVTAD